MPLQGYGDHKPKSSTAAQEVKTLDGVFTEQVSEACAREKQEARSRENVICTSLCLFVAFACYLC